MIRFETEGEVVHIQTHTSHVFLKGDEVWKIKKPVDFSFLDYSTLALRKTCCEKEVSLNRRFSPEVYLGVVPLYPHADGDLTATGEGEPVEYAVRMRRLPEEAMLAKRLAAGDVRNEEMVALADLLGRFYESADSTPEIRQFGSVDQVRHNTVENFDTTMDFEEDLFPELTRQLLRTANQAFLLSRRDLFESRAAAGKVLDGHGDLKPENLFLTEAGPVVTDCIEFNERFRYGDVLVDLGYLTMGLMDAGRKDLRDVFLDRYREKFENDYPEDLLAYYETYRAVVKGKIEGYRSRQPEVPEEEREEARLIARRHFALAQQIVLGFRPLHVILAGVGEIVLPVIRNSLDDGISKIVTGPFNTAAERREVLAGSEGTDAIRVVIALTSVETEGFEVPAEDEADVVLTADATADPDGIRGSVAMILAQALLA